MNHECLNHASWLNLEFAASFPMKFKLWSYTQYYRSSMVSSWYIFYAFFHHPMVLLIFEGEAGRRPWIDPDDILDYYFARWNLPVAIPAVEGHIEEESGRSHMAILTAEDEWPARATQRKMRVLPQGRFLGKTRQRQNVSAEPACLATSCCDDVQKPVAFSSSDRKIHQQKAWKKPDEFMCLVLPFVCPPLAKGTWGSLQSRFFQSGKVLFWFKSRSTWLERLQKITEKLSPWNQSLLWMTGLMPFLSKQKMQANVEEALLLALVERSLSLFENKDVPAINKWFFVVLWPSS